MFRNGYSKNSPFAIAECIIAVGLGKPEWGAKPGVEYYILKITKIKENV